MDPVKILPTEVIEEVLSYLSLDELLACCLVSQKWNIAANNETLWKEFCLKNGWSDCGSLKKYVNCFNFINSDSLRDSFNNMGEWKKHFVLKTQIQKNWRTDKAIDHVIRPPKVIDEKDVGNISSVSSDGHNILAFGFARGLLSLFNLKNNGSELLLNKKCPLNSSVDYIEIINENLILIQENLLQIYKLGGDDANLELYRAKLINTTSVTNVDLTTLLQLDSNARTGLIRESRERFDDNVLFHFSESYLVITTFFSRKIYIYSVNSDFIEPDITFNLDELEIDVTDKFIFNVHCKRDILYILLSVHNYAISDDVMFNTSKFSLHTFSVKTKQKLFSNNISNNRFISKSNLCTIETNERYLVLRFEMDFFFIYDRSDGKLLINDRGVIFLNANSDPSLIGICLDISFQITDPTTKDCYFCITLEGSPVSMFSDVLITASVEYDRDGNGSTEIEFLNLYRTVRKIGSLEFPKNPNVALIYKDDTKVIFYAERDHVVARSFLV